MRNLTTLENGQAEVLEIQTQPGCRASGVPIHRLNSPRGAIIAAIVKGSDTVIPRGGDIIKPGDTVIVLTTNGARRAVSRLFEKRSI